MLRKHHLRDSGQRVAWPQRLRTWLSQSLFGCRHAALSRPFTINGRTYEVCLECGARFAYSLDALPIHWTQCRAGSRSPELRLRNATRMRLDSRPNPSKSNGLRKYVCLKCGRMYSRDAG